MARAQAMFRQQFIEEADRQIGHGLGVAAVCAVFSRHSLRRPHDPFCQCLVLLAGDPAGQVQQQAVPHGHLRDEQFGSLRGVEQRPVDHERRVERLSVRKLQFESPGQLFGGLTLALTRQLVKGAPRYHEQTFRANRLSDPPGHESRVASDCDERPDAIQGDAALRRTEDVRDMLTQNLRGPVGGFAAAKQSLPHADGSHGQALGFDDLPLRQHREQRASPADMRNQEQTPLGAQLRTEMPANAGHGQPALLRRIQDLQFQPGGHQHPIEEHVAVAGFADRAGRHRAQVHRPIRVQDPAKLPEDPHGRPNRRTAQPAASKCVLTKPDTLLQVFENFDAPIRQHLGHDQPDRIRTDVHPTNDLCGGLGLTVLFLFLVRAHGASTPLYGPAGPVRKGSPQSRHRRTPRAVPSRRIT